MIRSEGLGFKSSPRYYNRRNSNVSPVFVAGVGLERLTFTFPLNPPLIKGDLWQGLPCIASQYKRLLQSHR